MKKQAEQNFFLVLSDDELSEGQKEQYYEELACKSESFNLQDLLLQEIENKNGFSFEMEKQIDKRKIINKKTQSEKSLKNNASIDS